MVFLFEKCIMIEKNRDRNNQFIGNIIGKKPWYFNF